MPDVRDRKSALMPKQENCQRAHFLYPLSSRNENSTQSSILIVEDKEHLRTMNRISKYGRGYYYVWVKKNPFAKSLY